VRRPRLSPPAGVAPFLRVGFACSQPLLLRPRPAVLARGPSPRNPHGASAEVPAEPIRPASQAPRPGSVATQRSIAPAGPDRHGLSRTARCRLPGRCQATAVISLVSAPVLGQIPWSEPSRRSQRARPVRLAPSRPAAFAGHEVPGWLPRATRCRGDSWQTRCGAWGSAEATLLAPFGLQAAARAWKARPAGSLTLREPI